MDREQLFVYFRFLSPIAHLGDRQYSFLLPIIFLLPVTGILEFYAYTIAHDPNAVGTMAIALYIALIIYFAFRFGLRGGLSAVLFTLSYYFYIIYTRNHTGEQLQTSLYTVGILGMLYLALACTIGWLKQTIDTLLVHEVNAKRRLLTIIRQLPVGIIITDAQGELVQTNDQLAVIFGRKLRPGFQIGKETPYIKRPQTQKPISLVESPTLRSLKDGRVVRNKEFVIEKPDKSERNVLISAAPIFDKEGKIAGGIGIMQDITSIRELEKRKDDFVNIASHELKTPITSLVLYLDILRTRLRNKQSHAALEIVSRISDQIDNLQELIRTLLDVSRIQTGKISFKKEIIRLDLLIEDVIRSLQDGKHTQKILFKSRPKTVVRIDKYRLSQVLSNLITNAIKYSSGRGNIHVNLSKIGDEKVLVSVRDFGIGIAKNQQKKVFEKLYQVKEDKAATFPGFGMGLYISKEIITRHKGKIWVESELGAGSVFYFTLPAYV